MTTRTLPVKPIIRLAFIDDDRTRDAVVRLFFDVYSSSELSHFNVELTIPGTPSDAIRTIRSLAVDAVVMDVLLKRNWGSEQVDDLVKITGKSEIPLGFVSGDMGQVAAISEMRSLASNLSSNPKFGYFTYVDSFRRHLFEINTTTQALERIASHLREEVISLWNIIFIGISEKPSATWHQERADRLTFLHLTDTHFGKTDVKQLSVEGIIDVVRNNSIKVDALLWTGDIADKGLPSDYMKASHFYSSLISKGALSRACQVFLVAGNHDHCWPLALATNVVKLDDTWQLSKKPNPDLLQLAPYRVQPFSEFYERTTGRRMDVYREGWKWIDIYRESGLLVLEFSIEEFGVAALDAAGRKDIDKVCGDILDELREIFSEAPAREFVILVLIHGTDPSPTVEIQLRQFVHRLAAKGHPIIVVGGHYHVGSTTPEGSALYVVGPPISEEVVDSRAILPGISFVTIDTSGLPVASCEIATYKLEQNRDGVLEDKYFLKETFRTRVDSEKFTGHWLQMD